jgi:sulfite exporter TauE/SafE
MTGEIIVLASTAVSLGFIHTILGPDHYLPFIVLGRTRGWSAAKTAMVTSLCGLGHVLSSIILGFLGISLGIAVFRLESIESSRGDLAGWLLLIFGFVYFLWGVRRAVRARSHGHPHRHENGRSHFHHHGHIGAHSHVHAGEGSDSLTPWVLFTIFVFGPCEPLIPLIMYPAAKSNMAAVVCVATLFGLTTIATMLTVVMASFYGLSRISLPRVGRYSHALAGLAIFLCGGAIKFLGI